MNGIRAFIKIAPLWITPFAFPADAPEAIMPEIHFDFLNESCLDCHDSITEEGSMNLEELSFNLDTLEAAEKWQKVLNALNSGEMPPEDEPQPGRAEKTAFLDDLSHQLVTARKILSDSGGVITMRRLNRREYENTLEDLLGVKVSADELPNDGSSGGFDTVGSSLFFSSDQFEQYLTIARRVLDESLVAQKPKLFHEKRESEVDARKLAEGRYKRLFEANERAAEWRKDVTQDPTDFGFIDSSRVEFEEGQFNSQGPAYKWFLDHPKSQTGVVFYVAIPGAYVDRTTLPPKAAPGRYRLRARVAAFEDAPSHRKFLEYGTIEKSSLQGELDVMGARRITGTLDNPQIVEIPIEITSSKSREIGLRERQPNSRNAARFALKTAKKKGDATTKPALWIDWVEWEGPLVEQWPSPYYDSVFFKGPDAKPSDAYASKIIERFAQRAFRIQDPKPSFLKKLTALYRNRRAEGDSFEDALKEPLSVVLASPAFLFLKEPGQNEEKRELTDLELAVRLSYFLWSGPPDDALYEAARCGDLSKPAGLRHQTERMLAHPKAWEFISGFTDQWLTMDRLDFFQFNYELYPEFDDSIKIAARDEIFHTVNTLIQEKLPIGKLLKSDFVVINDLLANFYDIEGVEGHQYRKVKVAKESPRGGLLGSVAVMAMGSDGERSSPVERGAWVMRKLLNDPPPPAPANVPQLSRFADDLLPARDLQIAHMEEPQCAQCHRKIDPIGYGLQNFNAVGKWRDEERVETDSKKVKEKVKFHPIDPSGTLPDKTPFSNYFELRDGIAEHESDFARGYTEALIEYGLGRPYGFTDYDLAEEILGNAQNRKYDSSAFIHALIQSQEFKEK